MEIRQELCHVKPMNPTAKTRRGGGDLRTAFSYKPIVSGRLTVLSIQMGWKWTRHSCEQVKESSGSKTMLNPEIYSSVRTESLQISYTVAFNN